MGPRYATLADFLASQMLTIDASTDDGWGAPMSVKGREIEATILFADITSFSARTADLEPSETLAFVNHFFAWTSAEALKHGPGIVDKYIGDEVMVIFSNEFGSDDPLLDAVHAARAMGQYDASSFMPHIGIASGRVMVGYVGTPQGYSVSVFGTPVALASRCAAVPLPDGLDSPVSSYISLPAHEIAGRDFEELIPTEISKDPTFDDVGKTVLANSCVSPLRQGDAGSRHARSRRPYSPPAILMTPRQQVDRGVPAYPRMLGKRSRNLSTLHGWPGQEVKSA